MVVIDNLFKGVEKCFDTFCSFWSVPYFSKLPNENAFWHITYGEESHFSDVILCQGKSNMFYSLECSRRDLFIATINNSGFPAKKSHRLTGSLTIRNERQDPWHSHPTLQKDVKIQIKFSHPTPAQVICCWALWPTINGHIF